MNDQPPIAPYGISDFLQWRGASQLVLQPKFQRGRVWSDKAQSYLIDTILRKLPIPPIVLRSRLDIKNRVSVREVVDGQQRLTAVFRFIEGEIPILGVHNKEFGGKYFSDLPEDIQGEFLSYKFAAWMLENIKDSEVLSIFARLNTYLVPLNKQELRNSQHFGEFKQCVYGLAEKHLEFWKLNKVFTDSKIARMKDAEFISTILMSFERGIIGTKTSEIDKFYEDFDENYPRRNEREAQFGTCIDILGQNTPHAGLGVLSREILFFSIFLLVYDIRFGLPNGLGPVPVPADLKGRLAALSTKIIDMAIRGTEDRDELEFQRASSRATADVGARRTRHRFFWNQIIRPE